MAGADPGGYKDTRIHTTEREIRSYLPQARVETIDCGSEIPMEAPGELAALIMEFVSALPRVVGGAGFEPA
jgi:hypothetical protein